MNKELIAVCEILINAKLNKVWEVMIAPEKIKVYLFGTEVTTDWKKGSPVYFKGNYSGRTYHDKGNVLINEPLKKLQYTYWSNFSGLEDKEENYAIVTYLFEKVDEKQVKFTWHQQGFPSEEGKCHTEEGLKSMLEQIKKLAESN